MGIIDHSIIVNNGVGVETNNAATATIYRSIIAFNEYGLSASNFSVIYVNNPIYFNGVVNLDNGTAIFNQNLTPSNGERVVCILGNCQLP